MRWRLPFQSKLPKADSKRAICWSFAGGCDGASIRAIAKFEHWWMWWRPCWCTLSSGRMSKKICWCWKGDPKDQQCFTMLRSLLFSSMMYDLCPLYQTVLHRCGNKRGNKLFHRVHWRNSMHMYSQLLISNHSSIGGYWDCTSFPFFLLLTGNWSFWKPFFFESN